MIVLVTLFSLMCIVHGVMYNLFGHFFSFADLSYAGEGAAFFSFSYLVVRKGMLICVLLAIAGGVVLALCMPKKKYRFYQPIIAGVLALAAIGGIAYQHNQIVSKVRNEFTWDQAMTESADASIYQNMTNVNRAMSMSGIYQYLFRSAVVTSGIENKMQYSQMYSELDAYYAASEKQEHPDNEMTGIFEGKNVLFIMMESVDTWMLTEEYMPNLYRVQQESINFANHYTPLYITAGTFNTEFIANTGLVPPTTGINSGAYTANDFPTALPHLFSAQGYSVNSFHSANASIYERGAIHANLGYEAYHSWVEMGMTDYQLDSQLIEGYDLMTGESPFFSFIITYSGHGPYTQSMSNISDPHMDAARAAVANAGVEAGAEDLEEYTYAIAHAMETDAFVGELMERLEQDGHLEDTVLVFFADHYGKYMTNHQFLMELKGVDNTDMLCNTPFFIYSKDMPARTVTKITSTMDIAPTMANLFGLDVNYAYYVGDDIFGDGGGYVIFAGNNWYDGEIYYSPNYSGEWTEEILKRNQDISQRMNAVWDTLRCDYFAHLE